MLIKSLLLAVSLTITSIAVAEDCIPGFGPGCVPPSWTGPGSRTHPDSCLSPRYLGQYPIRNTLVQDR